MKRLALIVIVCCALTGTMGLALGIVYGQAVEKEKTFTLTEKQWQAALDKRIAQELEKAGLNVPVSDEKVRDPSNWHRAIFNNWEYTVYTGPGQLQPTRWIPPQSNSQRPAPGKAAPDATPPAGSK